MSQQLSIESTNNELDEVNPCTISLLFWLGGIINHLKSCFSNIYNNSELIRDATNSLTYTTTSICNTLHNIKTEPSQDYWWDIVRIQICALEDPILEEKFIFDNTVTTVSVQRGDLIIRHLPKFIICSINNRASNLNLIPVFNKMLSLSEIRFLSVEYNHPSLIDPIQLVLENKWYTIGNEIFNFIHVLKMLQYQVSAGSYIFDDRYTLKIIDSNIHIFEITASQYIRLEQDNYQIVG